MNISEFIKSQRDKPMPTYDEWNRDDHLERDPLSTASDDVYAEFSDSFINPLATSAGIRRG